MRIWLIVFLVLAGGLFGASCVLLWLGNVKVNSVTGNELTGLYYSCIALAFSAGGIISFSLLRQLKIEKLFVVLAGMAIISFAVGFYIQMDGFMSGASNGRISSLLLGVINGIIIPVVIGAILYQKKEIILKSKNG